ncbi:hypothetical protein CesoFtcFv8_027063 [Champsocephalus esox]|uniref:Uncharacterized protein n=1 Tax=Champsocephalus esox TaxID=159716 RepID=A0AAN8B0C7_9TELE|nr:hypothetical protein CesoFtcFv8_027063 [Champsocephalus esox]
METRLNFLQTRKDWREEQAEWLLCFLPHCLPGRLSWGGLWSSPICLSTGVNISAAPSPPSRSPALSEAANVQI